jgi:8-amino-3,8-dideoxy-alpha-D-manno-octulosonate transaminase
MGDNRKEQALALHGSQQAVTRIEGKGRPKIGVEEFLSVADRFGVSRKGLADIKKIVERENLDPMLANYYSGLKESKVEAFQREARKFFGVKYALGVSSGTGALHSAFIAAGVGPGTEVIVPAIGFFATAAAVVASNGVPVFCDVDESLHLDPKKIEALVTKRTVAIAPTCVMGGVPDMAPIMKVARKHKLQVIEDCAQACGASYRGKPVGSIGDFGCFSISAYKIVGCGEGGLLLTNTKRLWERANAWAECGGLWRPDRFAPPRYPGELYSGTNYRLSELEAAVDAVQMRKVGTVVRRFRTVNRRITRQLNTYGEITPQRSNDRDGDVGYTLRFFPESIALGEKIVAALQAEGVACGMRGTGAAPDWHVYHEMQPLVVHGMPTEEACSFNCPRYRGAHGPRTFQRGACPVADDLYDRVITIGLNQWYTAGDCRNIARGINKVLGAYCTASKSAADW